MARYVQLLFPLDMSDGELRFPPEIKAEIVRSVAILLLEVLGVEEGKEDGHDLA